ncbi:7646_t:CDS:2, partial [Ambispora gerdemannii]
VVLAEADPNSQMCHLLQVLDLMKQKRWVEAKFLWVENLPSYVKSEKKEQVNLFGSLSECFFEQFFHDSLDQNLIIVKSTVTTECDSSYCPKKVLSPVNYFDIVLIKMNASVLSGSIYFETCLKHWQEPYLCICGSEFKTTNGEVPKNIPVNAYGIEKVTLVETGETKNVYRCVNNVTSTRQIDQRLPLILVINVTEISIDDEGVYLQNKNLSEEISFPYEDHVMAKRYRLAEVSYCNGSHHVADIYFEKTKNVGWYQYDGLEKTYHARAMYIGHSRSPLKNGYTMDFVIYTMI